ncbi:MAG: hypothetical protein ACXVBF_05405 [Flavisolibacter sp.]
MQTACHRLVVVFVCRCTFLYGKSQKVEEGEQKFLERPIHITFGPVFYQHPGFEISGAYFHHKNWIFLLQSWGSGWDSPEYPAPGPGQFGRQWPYDYFELSAQAGKWKVFQHHFFAFVSSGPAYINFQYPIRRDSFNVGSGIIAYQNATTRDRTVGLVISSGIGWRKWGWGLMAVPSFGINSIRSTASVGILLTITSRVLKKQLTAAH